MPVAFAVSVTRTRQLRQALSSSSALSSDSSVLQAARCCPEARSSKGCLRACSCGCTRCSCHFASLCHFTSDW